MVGLAGLQPRHSIGYGFTVACEVAALVGAAPGMRTEIDTAAAHLDQGAYALAARAAEIADRLAANTP